MTLRDYQARTVAAVLVAPERRVVVVAPTGSGKTVIGSAVADHYPRVLWVAHRRELLRQAAERLRATTTRAVGLVAPGEDSSPYAPIQVATVQTLLARDVRHDAELVILDEAHHYVAADWRGLAVAYPVARVVGLTATPQRTDGLPLGEAFDRLIVAAQYSELIRAGHLVQCAVYQPPEAMGQDLAQDPLVAYQRHAEGSRAFVFCGGVQIAYDLAARFCDAGIPAGTVEANTPRDERDATLARFAEGSLRVVTNVYALTEGVDVPAARTVILARGCSHAGPYLQMVGRVLRPHADKPHAILIDLSGATLVHGMPTEDRIYSLDGDGIRRTSPGPVRQCTACGAVVPGAPLTCPECGFVFPVAARQEPRIWDMALRAVFAGADTPETAKTREYQRLRALAAARNFSLGWVISEYRKLFGEAPVLSDVTQEERRSEFDRLRTLARSRGWKPGFAAVRWRETFGAWPPRAWGAGP